MTLRQRLLNAGLGLTEHDFHCHESDLYVLNYPGVYRWLRDNYQFWTQITTFKARGAWKAQVALDIPFGALDELVVAGV